MNPIANRRLGAIDVKYLLSAGIKLRIIDFLEEFNGFILYKKNFYNFDQLII
jgi:hypothetical protein